jgi:hypothetical protein
VVQNLHLPSPRSSESPLSLPPSLPLSLSLSLSRSLSLSLSRSPLSIRGCSVCVCCVSLQPTATHSAAAGRGKDTHSTGHQGSKPCINSGSASLSAMTRFVTASASAIPADAQGWIVRQCRVSRATGRTRALALSACALPDGAWRTPACTRQHPPRPRLRVPRLSQSSSVYILLRSESRDSSVILPGTHTEAGSQTSSRAPGQPITRARATRCRLSLRCAALPASSRACSRAPGPRQSGRRHLHPSGTHARAACRWPGATCPSRPWPWGRTHPAALGESGRGAGLFPAHCSGPGPSHITRTHPPRHHHDLVCGSR